MVLFNAEGKLMKFESAEAILMEFFKLRLEMYTKRKEHLEAELEKDRSKLANRVRFILACLSDEIQMKNADKAALVKQLQRDAYTPFPLAKKAAKGKVAGDVDEAKEGEDEDEGEQSGNGGDDEDGDVDMTTETKGGKPAGKKGGKGAAGGSSEAERMPEGYEYLVQMPLWSLTRAQVEKLKRQLEAKELELRTLQATTERQMWERDLDAVLVALEAHEAQEALARTAGTTKTGKPKKPRKPAAVSPLCLSSL
jgi:DNA topoisomerase-2